MIQGRFWMTTLDEANTQGLARLAIYNLQAKQFRDSGKQQAPHFVKYQLHDFLLVVEWMRSGRTGVRDKAVNDVRFCN